MNREDVERVVALNNESNNTLHGFGENIGIRLVERQQGAERLFDLIQARSKETESRELENSLQVLTVLLGLKRVDDFHMLEYVVCRKKSIFELKNHIILIEQREGKQFFWKHKDAAFSSFVR